MSSDTELTAHELVPHYDGPPVVGITPERAIFLYHLRVNPKKIPQSTGSMRKISSAAGESRCALGLGCQAFSIDVGKHTSYAELSQYIKLNSEDISDIWRLNDRCRWSFSQIADRVEDHFLDPNVKIFDPSTDGGIY